MRHYSLVGKALIKCTLVALVGLALSAPLHAQQIKRSNALVHRQQALARLKNFPSLDAYNQSLQAARAWADNMSRPGAAMVKSSVRIDAAAIPGGTAPVPASATWNFIGPNNTKSNVLFGFGPLSMSGRVNATAFDPKNVSIYYCASASGGIWKTVDKGVNWVPLTNANKFGYSFSSVMVDPVDDTIVYAGGGDYDGGDGPGFGLIKFKFTAAVGTASASYTATNVIPTGSDSIRGIAIDPQNHNHVLITTGRGNGDGVILSNVGPTWSSWIPVSGGIKGVYFSSIAYASIQTGVPVGSQVIYASGDYAGVFKSTDNGATFKIVLNVAPAFKGDGGTNRVDIATSWLNTGTVYAVSERTRTVYKSTDAGATWNSISNSLPSVDPSGGDTWGQAWYDFHLCTGTAVSTVNGRLGSSISTDVVYFGLLDVYQSPNGEDSWIPILNTYSGNDLAHTDQHGMAVSPFNPNLALIGNDGGVYQLTYSPGISNYSLISLNQTLGITQIYSSSFGFTDPKQAILGTQDVGHPHMDGDINNWSNPVGGDGSFAAMNPLLFGTQYAAVQFDAGGSSLTFTEDDWKLTRGQTAIPADAPLNLNPEFIPPFVMDRYNPDKVYVGQQFVWQGAHTPGTPGPPPVIGTVAFTQYGVKIVDPSSNNDDDVISALAVSPYLDGTLFAGTSHGLQWFTAKSATWNLFSGISDTGNLFQNDTTTRYIPTQPMLNGEISAIGTSTKRPSTIFVAMDSEFTKRPIYTGVATTVTVATLGGEPGIIVASTKGFAVGDQIVFDKEQNTIVGLGGNFIATKFPVGVHALGVLVLDLKFYKGPFSNLLKVSNLGAGFPDFATGYFRPTPTITDIAGSGAGRLPNTRINCIEVIPHDDDQIIVIGTDVGVFLTFNGGGSWMNLSNDGVFPSGLKINNVRYEPSTNYLYASTYGRGVWAKYIPDDPILAPIFKSTFNMYPTLQSYKGNRAKLSIVVDYFGGGQAIGGTPPIPPFEEDHTFLSASGWLQDNVSVKGAFDIRFKVNGFLSKRMTNTQIGSSSLVTPLVYAGDCNPIIDVSTGLITGYGDNVIDINDYNACLQHMGQFWTGPADVDGDGVVTARDLALIQANLGRRGDP